MELLHQLIVILTLIKLLSAEEYTTSIVDVDFSTEPEFIKQGDQVTFKSKVYFSNYGSHRSDLAQFRWYFKAKHSDDSIYQLVHVGQNMTLTFRDKTFEGFYNLSVLPEGPKNPLHRVESVKYVSFGSSLNVQFFVDNIEIKPNSGVTVLSLRTNDTFTLKCRIHGFTKKFDFVLPHKTKCQSKTSNFPKESSDYIDFIYDGCSFHPGDYGCVAEIDVRKTKSVYRLASTDDRKLEVTAKDGGNGGHSLSRYGVISYCLYCILVIIFRFD